MCRSGGVDNGYFTANEMCRHREFPRATAFRDIAQSGSASALGAEGRGFKSLCPDQTQR